MSYPHIDEQNSKKAITSRVTAILSAYQRRYPQWFHDVAADLLAWLLEQDRKAA